MKIEIAENMVYSYLKHVECCRIIQTNWKTSGKWKTTEYDEREARKLFKKLKSSESFKKIFRKNNFDQLIKQAEIDVVGINTAEDSIFGIDVAFHISGLNYNGPEESIKKVFMKIFRTILIMQTYFSGFDKYNSFFVAPKISGRIVNEIKTLLKEAELIINEEMISINLISNDEFYETIFDPLITSFKEEHDTGELFSRAIKLVELDPRRTNGSSSISKQKTQPTSSGKRTENGMCIGQFVQYHMRKLHENGTLTEKDIANLQDKGFSKNVLNQNIEVLRFSEKGIKGKDGRNRYYARELFFKKYRLSSQWVEYHWEPFLVWLETVTKR
jgi:hypothetical protein